MSTVMAFKTSEFSLLITDTRLCKYDEKGNLRHDDSVMKMRYISGVGFLAGIGVGELIYSMHKKIMANPDINIIRPTLRNSFMDAYRDLYMTASEADKGWLCKTGICVSWFDTAVQLRVFGQQFKNAYYADLNEDQAYILYPDGLTKEFIEATNANLMSIPNARNMILLSLLNAFKKISTVSDFVSDVACVGIIMRTEKSPLFYMDNANELINKLKNNVDLVNVFSVHENELTYAEVL